MRDSIGLFTLMPLGADIGYGGAEADVELKPTFFREEKGGLFVFGK